MQPEQKQTISHLINLNLDQAENVWAAVGSEIVQFSESATFDSALMRAEVVPSQIPGHSMVSDQKPEVDTFIALVADMRDSSKHLMQAISPKTASVSQLQRVFYETSALLPAIAQTVKFNNGQVTEYLGDGLLALFRVTKDAPKSAFYSAHQCGVEIIGEVRDLVNKELAKRYKLPSLDLGVGLSVSRAIVTLIGLSGEKHPKVIGECVYRASKVSKGRNEMHTDDLAKVSWPTRKDGKLTFSQAKKFGPIDGYLVGLS